MLDQIIREAHNLIMSTTRVGKIRTAVIAIQTAETLDDLTTLKPLRPEAMRVDVPAFKAWLVPTLRRVNVAR